MKLDINRKGGKMSDTVGNRKLSGLMTYLNSLVKKGRVRPSVVTPLKTAVRQIFETVEGEKWEDIEVSSIDLDDYMLRFQNLALDRYNADSYSTYRRRADRALSWYNNFLSNPGWIPPVRKSPSFNNSNTKPTVPQKKTTSISNVKPQARQSGATGDESMRQELISFPFPMSDGSMASLYLPRRIGANDAKRLADFISSLVVNERKEDVV